MSIPRHRFFTARHQSKGIALLVTIILLVFLVLIVVALSSLVRVETQIAVNTDAVAQARQNALVGVNMALGRLQETAGPDKRITARADILGPVAPPNAYLTGVWDKNGNLITWLVNGNDNHTPGNPRVTPDSNFGSGNTDRILDPTSQADNPITNPLYNDTAPTRLNLPSSGSLNTFPIFGPGHVYLVSGRVNTSGENLGSVDVRANVASNSSNKARYKDALAERVILRKSPIVVDGASVPGKAAGANVQIGNYAFWVADDGIRASLGSGNRAGALEYDDSAAPANGMNYIPTANNVTDSAYLARKFLNGIQLQSTRADLVLRDTSANEIFTAANRVGFYPMLSHPANVDFFAGLSATEQVMQAPVLRDYASVAVNPNIGGLPGTFAGFQDDIRDRLRQRFHDITPKSRAVLTDMISGGLKKDLSFEVANSFPNTAATLQPGIQNFLNVWRQVQPVNSTTSAGQLALEVNIIPPPDSAFGTPLPSDTAYYAVAPVISAFEFRIACSVDSSTNLKVEFTGLVELWNPYNLTLKLPASQNLYVTIPLSSPASPVRLSNFVVTDSASSTYSVNVERTLFDGSTGNPALPAIGGSYAVYRLAPVSGSSNWQPGETKRWKLQNLLTKTAYRDDGSPITGLPSGAVQVLQSAATDVTVTLHMGDATNPTNANDFANDTSPLYEVRDVPYAAPAPSGTSPAGLSYFFRPKDQAAYGFTASSAIWMEESNPQGPVLVYDAGAFYSVASSDFRAEGALFGTGQSLLVSTETGGATFVTLFDVPRQEPTGIGAFQHLAFSPVSGATNVRAYRIGSPNSSGINNIFDSHFISTVPRGTAAISKWSPRNGELLANTALRVYDPAPAQDTNDIDFMDKGGTTGLQTEKSAEYLLIENAFNINSTSVAAWMGVLGGSLPALADPSLAAPNRDDYIWPAAPVPASELKANWRYLKDSASGNVQTQALANVFFRLPQTAHNLDGDYVTRRNDLGASATVTAAAFRLGLREFTARNIEDLATAVVARLRARGSPFLSLAAFVDSGLLDQAISDANLNKVDNTGQVSATGQDIPKLSTAYLSQGDILQLIAPRLTARSDTFTVRSYGDVVDPVSGEVRARAWVEATIQRTPNKHRTANQPTDNMTDTQDNAGNFGRQFKIVSLRWLTPSDI
jgi:hypothetical protein